jgi:hypothetical protein
MEFASEMIIKATLLGEAVVEVPATLARDLRGRPPHLRPWRDGWRHLRYILMLSPHWLFGAPAGLGFACASAVLTVAGVNWLLWPAQEVRLGNYWMIFAGALLTVSHVALILALAGQLYGIKQRYRRPGPMTLALTRWLTLEMMLAAGLLALLAGGGALTAVFLYWSANHGVRIDNVFPAVLGTALLAIGAQTILGGFLLAIVGGNAAAFLEPAGEPAPSRKPDRVRAAPGALE